MMVLSLSKLSKGFFSGKISNRENQKCLDGTDAEITEVLSYFSDLK